MKMFILFTIYTLIFYYIDIRNYNTIFYVWENYTYMVIINSIIATITKKWNY